MNVRISEALNLVLEDVNVESGIVTVRAAKNMKDRLIPMADRLTKRVLTFVNEFHRYSDGGMWLFPACHNGTTEQWDRWIIAQLTITSGIICLWPTFHTQL